MECPQKRRRLSPVQDEDYQSASDTPNEDDQTTAPTSITTTSRIKSRHGANGTTIALSNDIPIPPSAPVSPPRSTFPSLGISPWLLTALSTLSIHHPTPIQTTCIPPILAGHDCIGSSQTGSGKTLAFVLPILHRWSENPSSVFALILTPTRELALQIHEQIIAIGSRRGLRCCLVTGGADMRAQAIELERKPHLVVATPGRLADHLLTSGEETVGGLRRCRFVVLDEADRLLAGGGGKGSMLDDLETCLHILPPPGKRQTLLFTATITPEVRALKDTPRAPGQKPVFLSSLSLSPSLTTPSTLKQTYQLVPLPHKEKYLHILLLTPANTPKSVLIFTNRSSTATLLEHLLRLLDHRVTSLHSGLPHQERISNLSRFRARSARILVATDVASRGLDIPNVDLVINYDLPRDPDTYVHRVGRTARAGRGGLAMSLVGVRDVELVKAIEERTGCVMEEFREEGVSVEARVVKEALKVVGEKKREAVLDIEEGRDVRGKRRRNGFKKAKG